MDRRIDLIKKKEELFINSIEDNIVLQDGCIPVYHSYNLDFENNTLKSRIYDNFFSGSGVLIVRNAYSKEIMEDYNVWCEKMLGEVCDDPNFIHPKQKDKYLINNVIERMSSTNPQLLINLLNNRCLTNIIDILLGFAKIGSCTTHWIKPGGDRQISHVDYPIHVGSGKFWENSSNKVNKLITPYQLEQILPYYSIQVLVASDSMSKINGSTEVIPFSHHLPKIDLDILDGNTKQILEPHFKNVTLEKGDFLIFNRRLVHRGGKNISKFRRNSLIFQCVWLFGVGQEILNYDKIITNLEKSSSYNKLNQEEKQKLKMRLKGPYPIDVSQNA